MTDTGCYSELRKAWQRIDVLEAALREIAKPTDDGTYPWPADVCAQMARTALEDAARQTR